MSLPFSTTHTAFENIGSFFEDHVRVPNKGEGNCFFHAVGECILPGKYSTDKLRKDVGKYLEGFDLSLTPYNEKQWEEKVLIITKDKVWVDEIWTHFAISHNLHVSLHIYQPEVSDQVLIIEDSTQCDRKIIPLVLSRGHYETITAETRKSYIEEYTKKSSEEMWACEICTFKNHNALTECEMCSENMPNLV
jgi:hypothetical protein